MILKLELIDDRDIVVSHPKSGFSVTYRKTGNEPMLIAIDGIDRVTDGCAFRKPHPLDSQ